MVRRRRIAGDDEGEAEEAENPQEAEVRKVLDQLNTPMPRHRSMDVWENVCSIICQTSQLQMTIMIRAQRQKEREHHRCDPTHVLSRTKPIGNSKIQSPKDTPPVFIVNDNELEELHIVKALISNGDRV